jgi:hypothetical protein
MYYSKLTLCLEDCAYQLGNGSTIDFAGVSNVHRGGILISALLCGQGTHQEII